MGAGRAQAPAARPCSSRSCSDCWAGPRAPGGARFSPSNKLAEGRDVGLARYQPAIMPALSCRRCGLGLYLVGLRLELVEIHSSASCGFPAWPPPRPARPVMPPTVLPQAACCSVTVKILVRGVELFCGSVVQRLRFASVHARQCPSSSDCRRSTYCFVVSVSSVVTWLLRSCCRLLRSCCRSCWCSVEVQPRRRRGQDLRRAAGRGDHGGLARSSGARFRRGRAPRQADQPALAVRPAGRRVGAASRWNSRHQPSGSIVRRRTIIAHVADPAIVAAALSANRDHDAERHHLARIDADGASTLVPYFHEQAVATTRPTHHAGQKRPPWNSGFAHQRRGQQRAAVDHRPGHALRRSRSSSLRDGDPGPVEDVEEAVQDRVGRIASVAAEASPEGEAWRRWPARHREWLDDLAATGAEVAVDDGPDGAGVTAIQPDVRLRCRRHRFHRCGCGWPARIAAVRACAGPAAWHAPRPRAEGSS